MLSRVGLRSCAVGSRLTHTSSNSSQAVVPADGVRNEVDFPRRPPTIDPAPVRMAFIPQTWFDMLYPKTGVTGPYMLGVGLTTFLVSKEVYVIEHEFYTGFTLAVMAMYAVKKFGPSVAQSIDDGIDKVKEDMRAGRTITIDGLNTTIAAEELSIEQAQGQTVLFQAKKDNIGLQLEAAYRARLQLVHSEMKKRLDYQLETSNVNTRFEQRHMVDWIVQSVRKSITPAQEAASLKQCVADLKGLAARS